MTLNFTPGTIFHRDNLDVLCGMNSNTVDLIVTDSLFNTDRNREVIGGKPLSFDLRSRPNGKESVGRQDLLINRKSIFV